MSENPYEYEQYCKYCEVYNITEGPHHKHSCPRHRQTLSRTSELANRYKCKFCGVKPFAAGPHHKKDCRRFVTL